MFSWKKCPPGKPKFRLLMATHYLFFSVLEREKDREVVDAYVNLG